MRARLIALGLAALLVLPAMALAGCQEDEPGDGGPFDYRGGIEQLGGS